LKIYHFSGGRADSEKFFLESLKEHLKESGLSVTGPAPREQAGIRKGPYGKPYFSDPELEGIFFSRSHSKGHEVLCFSDGEIGIDCENTEARQGIAEKYPDIARRCFTEDEIEFTGDSVKRFFEIWTAKEAYMKYTGRGFAEGFRAFSVFSLPGVSIETGCLTDAPHVVYSICRAERGM